VCRDAAERICGRFKIDPPVLSISRPTRVVNTPRFGVLVDTQTTLSKVKVQIAGKHSHIFAYTRPRSDLLSPIIIEAQCSLKA
jgi:hypothetical protein